jgi:Flp pilus assembly pilin Flp
MHRDEHLPPALVHFLMGRTGASSYEYALIAALVGVVGLILFLALGKSA